MSEAYPYSFGEWLKKTLLGLLGLLVVGAVVLLAVSSVHAVVITDKLVARYDFDEGAGATLGDLSGFDNNGTLIGSPSWITTRCLSGSCLNLTGTGTYVNITSSGSLTGWNNFTIAGWVNFNTVSGTQYILSKDKASAHPSRAYGIYLAAGNLNYEYWNSTGGAGSIVSDPHGVAINTSQAVCFAFVRDTTQSSNNLKVYYDGVLESTGTGPNGPIANDPSTPFQIGRRGDGTGQANASIDRLWIFNRTLTTGEMTTLCASAAVDTTPPTVNMTSPTNTSSTSTSIWVNVTLNENSGNVTAQLDGSTNSSLTNSSGNWNVQLTGLGEGAHNVRVFANDSNGNMNSSQIVYFTVDTTAPVITIGSPTNTTYQQYNTTLNATANEAISVWQYSLNGATNATFTPNITFIAQAGANNITVTANDTVGNRNTTTVYFTVTIPPPNLTITLYDETTELPVAGTNKTTNVTLRDPNTYATNITVNATNGTATFSFHGVNNTNWVVDAGLASTDYPYSRLTVVAVNQSNATVYLIPNGVSPAFLTFILNDLTGNFGGSLLQVKKNINGTQVELSRMNFDLEDKATAWMLLNNRYLLFIDNGAEVRSLGFFVPTANGSKTIVLGNVSLAPVTFSSWKDIVISLNWSNASDGSGTIFWRWNDTLNQTTAVEFFIYNGTNETASQAYYVGSNASVFSTTYQGINNTNLTYLVRWKAIHSRFGTIEGRQLVIFFNTQKRVGLGLMAPEPWHYLAFALMLIIILAGLFNAKNAALGGMVVVGAIILLNYWGWMQTSGIVVGTLAIIALIGKLKEGKA